jgi:hypothetical protein
MTTSTPTPTAGRAEGDRRRDTAHALLLLHRACLVRRVQRAYLDLLLTAVRTLAELRLIRRAGLTRSTRPEAHGRDLPLWEIADRSAVLAWLAANPDLPDPNPTQRTLFC